MPADPAARSERTPVAWWLAVAGLLAVAVWGASRLAFLCDDAFIHFRYAANLHDGVGIVWNPAPFAPVEGAGFLWVVVLAAIWGLFGAAPPDAANAFSILCGVVQLLLLAAAARRIRGGDGRRLPVVVGVAALAAIVGNRTFLQWMTSGLDTALFHVWLFWWTLHAFRSPERYGRTWLFGWSLAAALATLTRPDGLPLTCATAGVAVWLVWRGRLTIGRAAAGLSPLSLVVALTLWRRAYYGDWLPNTYYAKVVAAWPEAGARYFGCFALENGAWLWFPLVAVWLVFEARRPLRATFSSLLDRAPAAAAVAVVLFNASYYLFKVGGDHFEYRVLSPLAPLGVLACVAMAARISGGPRLPVATAAALLLAGSLGWLHLAWTHERRFYGFRAVTPAVPAPLKPIARWFDRQQLWLFARYIGLRCVHHEHVLELYQQSFPERQRIATAEVPYPALATGAVGMVGWVLPDCAILDEFGLNDWVVARGPLRPPERFPPGALEQAVAAADEGGDGWLGLREVRGAFARMFGTDPEDPTGDFALRFLIEAYEDERPGQMTAAQVIAAGDILEAPRRMAHERRPPEGYFDAFEPNVVVRPDGVTITERSTPLTADRIRAIEAEWRARVRAGELGR